MMSFLMRPLQRLAAGAALAATVALCAAPPARAATVVVDVAGAQSVGLAGEAGNTVWLVQVGAFSVLDAVSWSVTLDAFDPSTRAEMQVGFGATDAADMLHLAPAEWDADGGSGIGSHAGSLDFTGLGVAAGADGLLRIEFSERYKDLLPGVAEGEWLAGTLTLDVSHVPEPPAEALWLLALGALASSSGQRRSAKACPTTFWRTGRSGGR